MKKILSFTLMLMLVFGVCATVGAAETDTELQQKFYNYCLEVLPEDMKPSEGDNVRVSNVKKIEGVVIFKGICPWIGSEPVPVCKFIGDGCVYTGYTQYPYDLGVYVSSGDEIYTLEQAYEIGVLTDLTPVKNMNSPNCVKINKDCKHADKVIPMLLDWWGFVEELMCYEEDYEYYSSSNSATGDEATPDYVLITVYFDMQLQARSTMLFGDYIMIDKPSTKTPYPFGKCIYVPAENKVHSIMSAYRNVEGIENIFTEAGLGILVGDMDKDRKLTVKDATHIQKCLAGLEVFDKDDYVERYDLVYSDKENVPLYVSDFNRDGVRNVRDATAIQKSIAGLEY